MEENRRELATSRLLDIIRRSRGAPPKHGLEEEESLRSSEDRRTDKNVSDERMKGESTPSKATITEPEADQKTPTETESSLLDRILKSTDQAPVTTEVLAEEKADLRPVEDKEEIDLPLPPALTPLPVRLIGSLIKTASNLLKRSELKKKPIPREIADEETPASLTVEEFKKPVSIKRRVKGRRIYALDIGISSVKLVEVIKDTTGYRILDAGIYQFPQGLRDDESDLDVFISKAIRELLPSNRTKNADLHLLLPDRSALVKRIDLPAGEPRERLNAIKFQINNELPFPLEVCEISYRGWNPKIMGKQEVEALAVDGRELNRLLNLLDDCGLSPTHVTTSPAAMRFLIDDYKDFKEDEGAVAIADIGAAKTTISILDKGKLVLCRTIATGGDDFTQVLEGSGLGPNGEELDANKAEKYKIEHGLPLESETSSMRIAILMRPIAERISSEIIRSVEFYTREKSKGEIQKLILIGGGSKMKNLPKFLKQNLGVEVVIGDPAARVEVDEFIDDEADETINEYGPIILPALAVALDDEKELNLLPEELKAATKLEAMHRYIAPIAAIFVAVLLLIYALSLYNLRVTEIENIELHKRLSGLAKQHDSFLATKTEYDRLRIELDQRHNDFARIRENSYELQEFLRVLSHLVPSSFYIENIRTNYVVEPEIPEEEKELLESKEELEALEEELPLTYDEVLAGLFEKQGEEKTRLMKRPVHGKVMEICGMVYPLGKLTEVRFANFVYSLENSEWFREVAVDSVYKHPNGKVEFKIICGL